MRHLFLLPLLVCLACSSEEPTPPNSEGSGGAPSPELITGGSPPVSPSSGGGAPVAPGASPYSGDVHLTDGTVHFRHASYTLHENNALESQNNDDIVTTSFPVKVIENDLVRVTVLPEFGGRILSIIYKPTNHELLYQNSVGTPFGDEEGNFYYDWLMVYGGIFPTFPEPEHGKAWFLPWESEVTIDNADEVAIRMTFTDDIAPKDGVPPERFWYGRTDLKVTATVRVRRGSSAVGFELSVENTRAEPVQYEYWTCTTLTPGSTPGDTFSPKNTEMIVPIDTVFSTYGWVPGVEESVGENLFRWDKLSMFSAWQEPGILYAHPRMTEDYWGVINHENEVGVFRVADANATPGLKFWTWGAESVNVDSESREARRPYIELWAGHSHRFFEPAHLAGRETKSWTETYLPTLDLSTAHAVNTFGAAELHQMTMGDMLNISAEVFSTTPGIPVQVTLFDQEDDSTLLEQSWTPSSDESTTFFATLASSEFSGRFGVRVENSAGEELLRATSAE